MHRTITKYIGAVLILALAAPSIASAARLDTIGFETNTNTANVEITQDGTFGAPDGISTTQAHGGTHAEWFGETTTAEFSWVQYKFRSAASAATSTVRAYVYLNQTFSAAQELLSLANETPGQLASLRLNASNQLCLFNVTPAQVGSCVAITTGAWHYIELSTNGSSNIFGSLDGTVFASGFGGTQTGAISRVYIGDAFSAAAKSDTYFDDIAINDSTGSTQTWFPGAGTDIRISPAAAGDSNTFATQTGGTAGAANNFTRVDETTPDGATTFNGSNTLNQLDLFAVGSNTIGSGSVTLVEIHDWYRASVASAESSFKTEVEKTTGGTKAQSAALTPNSTTFKSNANANPNLPPQTLYLDPDGAAWTSTTIGTMQIGYTISTASTNRADLSTIWAYVEYVPAVTPPATTVGSTICQARYVFVRNFLCR